MTTCSLLFSKNMYYTNKCTENIFGKVLKSLYSIFWHRRGCCMFDLEVGSRSVGLEGLQHWLRHSADVVLVVAESCEDPRGVHVLDVSVVAVGVSVHVGQFTCTIKKEGLTQGKECWRSILNDRGSGSVPPTAVRMASGAQVSHFLQPKLAKT